MNRFTLLAGTAVALLAASTALALPPIPPYVAEYYEKDPNGAKITATLKAQTGKCGMCHIPGADKKAKGHGLNDFGKAVHDNLKHKVFMAEHAITVKVKARRLAGIRGGQEGVRVVDRLGAVLRP